MKELMDEDVPVTLVVLIVDKDAIHVLVPDLLLVPHPFVPEVTTFRLAPPC